MHFTDIVEYRPVNMKNNNRFFKTKIRYANAIIVEIKTQGITRGKRTFLFFQITV